jgi:hypothetical protein
MQSFLFFHRAVRNIKEKDKYLDKYFGKRDLFVQEEFYLKIYWSGGRKQ